MLKKINLSGLHDVMVCVIENRKFSDTEVEKCFDSLPESIQFIAYQFGGSDTEFRDEAYKYLKSNKGI